MSQELPRQLTQWSELHPGIRIDIREERSREILLAVRDGVADVGIVTTLPEARDLYFKAYCRDRLCLIVPQGHPFKMSHARFEDLLGYDFVGLEDNAAITPLITEAAAAVSMPLRLRVQVRSFEAVCRLIAAGQGSVCCPRVRYRSSARKWTCVLSKSMTPGPIARCTCVAAVSRRPWPVTPCLTTWQASSRTGQWPVRAISSSNRSSGLRIFRRRFP